MRKNPNKDKMRFILLAVTTLLVALVFLIIAGLPSPALAEENSEVKNNLITETNPSKIETETITEEQETSPLPFDDQGNNSGQELECKVQSTEVTEAEEESSSPTSSCTTAHSESTGKSPSTKKSEQAREVSQQASTCATAPPPTTTTSSKITESTVTTTTQPPTKATTKAPAKPETTSSTTQIQGQFDCTSADNFIRLLNNYRTANGLAALQKSGQLTSIAEKRSAEISKEFSHAGISKYGNYGENIFMCSGVSQSDLAAKALQAFQNSSGHNMNQLSDRCKTIGVGHYIVSGNTHYLAVVFGY